MLFKLLGVLGLLLITAGILIRNRKHEDILYFLGGLCLLAYSISIRDWIFITLQVVFIAAALYDYLRMRMR